MKLCESLGQIISECGRGIIAESRFPDLILQRVTDSDPGVNDALRAFAALGLGKELLSLSPEDRAGYSAFTDRASAALMEKCGVSGDTARLALGSIASAIGLAAAAPQDSSRSPDHGSVPRESGSLAGMYRPVLPLDMDMSTGALRPDSLLSLFADERRRKSAVFTVSWRAPGKAAPGGK